MGYDLMGSNSNKPTWENIKNGEEYTVFMTYLSENNSIKKHRFICSTKRNLKSDQIIIFEGKVYGNVVHRDM